MSAAVVGLVVGDDPSAWSAIGFTVDGDRLAVGSVDVRLVGDHGGRGVLGWTLCASSDGDRPAAIDGIPTEWSDTPPRAISVVHPNGVDGLDHVVVMTPDVDRTVRACTELAMVARRERLAGTERHPMRQVFVRHGEVIIEIVGPRDAPSEPTGPATLWGLACNSADLDATAAHLGDRLGSVRAAVQDGRRIASLRHAEVGISVPMAFMSR